MTAQSDNKEDTVEFLGSAFGILMLIAGVILFFALVALPSIVAFRRNHPSKMGILVLNICLFWSFIGWVIALVWAFSGESRRT